MIKMEYWIYFSLLCGIFINLLTFPPVNLNEWKAILIFVLGTIGIKLILLYLYENANPKIHIHFILAMNVIPIAYIIYLFITSKLISMY